MWLRTMLRCRRRLSTGTEKAVIGGEGQRILLPVTGRR